MHDIVSQIQSKNIYIDDGIRKISDCFYKSAFTIFGKSTQKKSMHFTQKEEFKSPWFNTDCSRARKQLRVSN